MAAEIALLGIRFSSVAILRSSTIKRADRVYIAMHNF